MRRRGFLAGAAALLAAGPVARAAGAGPQGEAGILAAAVEQEQLNAYVYDAGVKSGLLDGELVGAIGNLAEQERQHADALATLLEALGGPRPPAPATPADADAALQRAGLGTLTGVSTRQAFLALAEALELREVALYTAAVADLGDVRLIQTVGSVLGAEGAHLVVVRDALGEDPVPRALEDGRG